MKHPQIPSWQPNMNKLLPLVGKEALLPSLTREVLGLTKAEHAAIYLERDGEPQAVCARQDAPFPAADRDMIQQGLLGLAGEDEAGGLYLPLTGFAEPAGCLVLRRKGRWSSATRESLGFWAHLAGLALDHHRLMLEHGKVKLELQDRAQAEEHKLDAALSLYDLYEEAINQAFTDGLTHLANKVFFFQRLDQEFAESVRYGRPLTLLMLDVDHFKHVNDAYGHQAGDAVLARLGSIIKQTIRASDLGARFGGEEFAVILPETDEAGAIIVAERIRAQLEEERFETSLLTSFKVTTSIGLASQRHSIQSPEALIEDADRALYQAKRTGRNRVCRNTTVEASLKVAQRIQAGKQAAIHEVAQGLSLALEARLPLMARHARRVGLYGQALAQALELPNETCQVIYLAGMLHDVGMLGLPDAVLLPPEDRSEEAQRERERHPELSAELLGRLSGFVPVRDAILHHHEHLDGSGYPHALTGDEIPLSSRILAICDAFDQLLYPRDGAFPRTPEQAHQALAQHAGTRYDPALLERFSSVELPLLDPHLTLK